MNYYLTRSECLPRTLWAGKVEFPSTALEFICNKRRHLVKNTTSRVEKTNTLNRSTNRYRCIVPIVGGALVDTCVSHVEIHSECDLSEKQQHYDNRNKLGRKHYILEFDTAYCRIPSLGSWSENRQRSIQGRQRRKPDSRIH